MPGYGGGSDVGVRGGSDAGVRGGSGAGVRGGIRGFWGCSDLFLPLVKLRDVRWVILSLTPLRCCHCPFFKNSSLNLNHIKHTHTHTHTHIYIYIYICIYIYMCVCVC